MESHRPLVTIGIPTYNRASGRLGAALDCALDQTYENIEIVVADNCSTDNTEEVVESYNNDKIQYIRHESNIGPINNFNSCLDYANGDYFLLFHDDDAIDKDFIECCINAVKGHENVGLIRTGIRLIDGEDNVIREAPNHAGKLSAAEYISLWLNRKTSFYLPCTLFNTERLKEVGGVRSPHDMFCDVFAVVKLVAKYERVDISDVKASFRRHDENFGSSSRVQLWCDDSLKLLELICNLFPDKSDKLRKEGLIYFCLKNYDQVRSMNATLLKRTLMYFKMRKAFQAAAPLWAYYRRHEIRPILSSVKRKILG